MFDDSPAVDVFPYMGNRQDYFPTVSTLRSLDFGPVKVNSNETSDEYQVTEI